MKNRSNKPRNLLHNHPLLRKGGVHEKTQKAKRRKEKQALRKGWFSLSAYCVLRESHLLFEYRHTNPFGRDRFSSRLTFPLKAGLTP
ncbi:MAG: hypothetical protein KZQ93_05270 [Candidatus Thiodiazotropha sp. (ex Monitilora ramsayi)]|nr:hypothetical protein [Candidatus Thiodiazotropha sp. (ex Monitilora ramsayi)]